MPEIDMPLEEAVKELTGFEILEIEKHYKAPMENLGGTRLLLGTVYSFESRHNNGNGDGVPSWRDVEGFTLRKLTDYFVPTNPDVDSEQGKESSEPTTEPESLPTGA